MVTTSHLWPFTSMFVPLQSIHFSSPTADPPQVHAHLLHPSYLFINYPSLSMRVFLCLSEWSSCNCFSLEQLEAAQRNRIETTFAFTMSWDGEEGGSTVLLPYTEQLLLPPLSLIYCLPLSIPPSTLSTPTTPTSSPVHSMAPLALSFQRVPRSTGACSSEQGIVHLVLVDELVCVCMIRYVCVRGPACVSTYK